MAEGISSIIKSLSLTGDMIQMMNESRSRQEEFTPAATRGVSLRSGAQQQLREMAQAVIVPLKNGLHSFNNVSGILLQVKENMVLPKTQTFHDIRREILNMKQQMEMSESVATRELLRLDGQTESLTAEQGRLAKQKQQKECELKNLETQLESHQSSLENYKEALETETRNLDSAEGTLRKTKRRRNEAETKRDVGVALMVIPVAGWIVGPPLALSGAAEMDQASDAVNRARREVQNCESEVDSYSDKVYEYKSLVRKAKTDIKDANYRIHQTEANLRDLSKTRMVVADIQYKMRSAVHHLGVLCGVGNVAELQTRRQVLLEPVMKVMNEMIAALGQITGDELLHTEGITRLMWDMKKNQRKLEQLAVKSSEAYCDYY